jgi:hypothetical protein
MWREKDIRSTLVKTDGGKKEEENSLFGVGGV